MNQPTPVTGEVWIADLERVRGSEQGGRRPVVILQNSSLVRFTTTFLAVPVTSNLARRGIPGTRFLVAEEGGLAKDSLALGFQTRALDRTRLERRLGKLTEESVEAIADAVLEALGINVEP